MTAATKVQALDVYLHGSYIGKLFSEDATLKFAYDVNYLQTGNARKLSVSLPLQAKPFEHQITSAFFSGLLPDDEVRRHLARYLGLSAKNTFALLKEIGGECAGAVSVYPEGLSPKIGDKQTYRVLEDTEAASILSSLDSRPLLAGSEDIRISGAGAQNKLMVAFVDGKIAIPKGSTASTHIIKPAINRLEDSVYNEFFCMKLAQAVGLPTPMVEILWLLGRPYYLIQRYDRRLLLNGAVTRLHQEDFCQALHIPPEIKYEDEGGPTLEQCFALLDQRIKTGTMAGSNKLILLRAVIFNYLIGNGDAHGKNFSILYDGEAEMLAPLYDLLSTVIYANAYKAKMAMKVGGKYKFKEVSTRHWMRLGESLHLHPRFVKTQINKMIDIITKAAPVLCNSLNSNVKTASPVYAKIISVVKRHKRQILSDLQN